MTRSELNRTLSRTYDGAVRARIVLLAPRSVVSRTLDENRALTIGRKGAESTDEHAIRIDDGAISSSHAQISFEGGRFVLVALPSTNGTLIDGELVEGRRTVDPGTVVRMGDTDLICYLEPKIRRTKRIDFMQFVQTLEARCQADAEPFAVARLAASGDLAGFDPHRRLDTVVPPDITIADGVRDDFWMILDRQALGLPTKTSAEELRDAARRRVEDYGRALQEDDATRPDVGVAVHQLDAHFGADLMEACFPAPSGAARMSMAGAELEQDDAALDRIARSNLGLLLLGETGTGKSHFAYELHKRSLRRGKFVRLSCGALQAGLSNELFGHAAGAFTGAGDGRTGRLGTAHRGTLFLDEVDCLTPEVQGALLVFLDSGEYFRVGSDDAERADVRVIAATNQDLEALIDRGRFRKDLYERIATFTFEITPLRERPADIRPFAERFLRQMDSAPPDLTPEAIDTLESHDWPGNVRELRNVVHAAHVLSGGRKIEPKHLAIRRRAVAKTIDASLATTWADLDKQLRVEQRRLLERTLEATDRNWSAAARRLWPDRKGDGPRKQVQRLAKELGLTDG